MSSAYDALRKSVRDPAVNRWLLPMLEKADETLASGRHGDLPAWQAVLQQLPEARPFFDGSMAAPQLGQEADDPGALAGLLMGLHPWRKGPLNIGGVLVDTEWQSNLKWARIAPHLDLKGHRVLDIGCGNGYYGWRMLAHGAECVIGIDPTLVFVMQWLACRHFCPQPKNFVLPMRLEDLPEDAGGFDTVFSMGVLSHRRDPVEHLRRLARLLKPGGQVLVETLVLEGDGDRVLVPEERYARMRNVWSVPSVAKLKSWLAESGLENIQALDVSATSVEEQRSTDWMRFESLIDSLDPEDHTRTVEGHPAPVRAALLASVR